MSNQTNLGTQYDEWITDDSPVAALTLRQWLIPVEGRDAIVFPPTFAKPERMHEDWLGYNIDTLSDGTKICLIDSVGSQANRMEPIFMRSTYRDLVPQVVIKAKVSDGEREVHLLEAGHRAADAVVRFSDLAEDLQEAFLSYRNGDAMPIAKLSPTSLVFGVWDSRATQVKLPRIVRSVIRAYDAEPLHRSAQYIPPIDYEQEGAIEPPKNKKEQDALSEWGLRHAPAAWSHGGVLVKRGIRRDAIVNLASLRALGADGGNEPTTKLRRYILSLALVSFTAPMEPCLRQGCELVSDPEQPAEWRAVRHSGQRDTLELSHEQAVAYAHEATKVFGVGESRTAQFDPKLAKKAANMSKQERKAARHGKKAES